jgi:hypothetical protein
VSTIVRTPVAEWRQNADGSWEAVPIKGGGVARTIQSGNPGGGSEFLTPSEVDGGDNVLITELPGGRLLIERGGHAILYEGVEQAWQPKIDFQGSGVVVADDPPNDRTVVTIAGPSGSMFWRGDYDSGTAYRSGDVVSFGDAIFVYGGAPVGFGFGMGAFGEGPFGGEGAVSGFGAESFGAGPFGG